MEKTQKINIISENIPLQEIMDSLTAQTGWDKTNISLQLKLPEERYRSNLDPAILVALISAMGTGITALITGLLHAIKKSADNRIVMVGKNGTRLEVPANTSIDKMDQLIEKAKTMDIEEIVID